jgi:hypothetical protein
MRNSKYSAGLKISITLHFYHAFFSHCVHFFLETNALLVLSSYAQYFKMDPDLFEDFEGASHAKFCFEVPYM